MKMTRHDPNTDMEMNMTPMIDIVFQLIIFFMIITDLTQKDLEELVLPEAKNADPDKPDPKKIRPVLNLIADGRMYIKGELLYDPDAPDDYRMIEQHLSQMARQMEKEPLNEANPGGYQVPANPVLVRADQSTPFIHIQKVMEICGKKGIEIWKVQLAASEVGDENAPGGKRK